MLGSRWKMVLLYLAWRARAISASFWVIVLHSRSSSAGQHVGLKAAIEGAVAGEEAAIERGDDEFEIVGVGALAFFQGAHRGAGAAGRCPRGFDCSCARVREIRARRLHWRRCRAGRCRNKERAGGVRSPRWRRRQCRAGRSLCRATASRPALKRASTEIARRRIMAEPSPVRSKFWRRARNSC